MRVAQGAIVAIPERAAQAYRTIKKLKKARSYWKLVKESIDEGTRSGGLTKLGIKALIDLASKVIGRSLSSHPYFTYHKVHIELLAQCMNAASNHDAAVKALKLAVDSGDAARDLAQALDGYAVRRRGLALGYLLIAGSLDTLRDLRANPNAASSLAAGQSPAALSAWTTAQIEDWRSLWCELLVDCGDLLAMACVEARAAEVAMAELESNMERLAKGGNFGFIARKSIERDRDLLQLDRMLEPGRSERAVSDPVGFAHQQVAKIEAAADRIGAICEAVMSDVVHDTALMATHLRGA